MKQFGKKVLAILFDVEAWLTFASILIVGIIKGLFWGWLVGIIVYFVVNLSQKARKRINFFAITPPGDEPPPKDRDPSGNN